MKNVKRVTKISSALILLIIVISSGCKKNNVNPASASLSVTRAQFSVMSDLSPANLAVAANATHLTTNSTTASPVITFTSGIANVSKFEFEAKKNGVETKFETQNLMNVDLFALTPPFVNTTIDTGTYKEIEVKLELTQSTTGAIPLTLMGNVTSPAGPVPFEFDFNQNLEIKAEAKDVVVSDQQSLKTVFLLHLNMILSTITADDVAGATLTNGKIIVSATSNAGIFKKITANLGNIGETEVEKENDGGEHGEHGGNDGGSHSGN